MSFLEDQIGMLKNAIENGIISKDSPLIQEQKELIIDMMYNMSKFSGANDTKSQIGASVDKAFADELDID